MSINVIWTEGPQGGLHGRSGYANCTMINECFDLIDCEHWSGWNNFVMAHFDFKKPSGAIIAIHGGNEHDKWQEINKRCAAFKWVIFIIFGDEAAQLSVRALRHPNSITWLQTPKPGLSWADRYFPCGYPSDCRDTLSYVGEIERDLDWSFAGQISHTRRHTMERAVRDLPNGAIVPSEGFGLGLDHLAYYRLMRRSKIVLCPSGPETPDSFRMAEALEAGCVPLIDAVALDGRLGYWEMIFGKHSFPIIKDWADAPQVINSIMLSYECTQRANIFDWRKFKLDMRSWLEHDLKSLKAI
jgi:hypothetical protein